MYQAATSVLSAAGVARPAGPNRQEEALARMNKLLAACFAAGMLVPAVLAGSADATHTASPGPSYDFVSGTGRHGPEATAFQVSARSGPFGENPTGYLSFTTEGQRFVAEVTCVLVEGISAVVTGVIRQPTSAAGQIVVMHAVDRSNPNDPSNPDQLRFSFEPYIFESEISPGCFLPILEPVPVMEGNIVVHDASPQTNHI